MCHDDTAIMLPVAQIDFDIGGTANTPETQYIDTEEVSAAKRRSPYDPQLRLPVPSCQ
jgi:hypothetical protein